MADSVQQAMERMVPDLRAFIKHRIFSQSEIQSIVRHRRQYEYQIRSRNVQPADFMQYIDYEVKLEKLRVVRLKKAELSDKTLKFMKTLSGIRRIHKIFHQLLRKYNTYELWLQYIQFSISCGSNKSLNHTFAQALRLHPLQVDLWIRAAYFEYEQNHDISAARVLLQRALRTLKSEKTLWIHYFRLELLYLKKLSDRLKVMGVDPALVLSEKLPGIDLDPEDKNQPQDSTVEQIQQATSEQTTAVSDNQTNEFFSGKIASIIFQAAVNEIPEFSFCLEFWKIYRQFSNTEKLQEEVLDVIRSRFSEDEEAQAFLCRVPLLQFSTVEESEEFLQALHQSIESFQQVIQARPSVFLYSQFVDFYRQLLNNSSIANLNEKFWASCLEVFENAYQTKMIDENLFDTWIDLQMLSGNIDQVRSVLDKAFERFPANIHFVLVRIQLELYQAGVAFECRAEHLQSVLKHLFERSFKVLSTREPVLPLWNSIFAFYGFYRTSLDKSLLLNWIKKTLLASSSADLQPTKEEILQFCFAQFGLEFAREVFKLFTEFPPTLVSLCQVMINIELSQSQPDVKSIRALYETAMREPSADLDVFISAIKFELATGHPERLDSIYWLAKKHLQDFNEFQTAYEKLK